MDEKLRELISLGASVSAHCFPCFDYHLKKARKLGLTDEEIHETIQMGLMVMNGAGEKMIEKIKAKLPNISIKENESCARSQRKKELRFIPFIHI